MFDVRSRRRPVGAMYGTGYRNARRPSTVAPPPWPRATLAVDIPSGVDGATGEVVRAVDAGDRLFTR